MRLSRPTQLAVAAAALLALTACSSIPFFGESKSKKEATEAEKAGRVAMVLTEERLKPSPDLASTSIELTAAVPMASWPEAGAIPAKVPGHVIAAESLKVAWQELREHARGDADVNGAVACKCKGE